MKDLQRLSKFRNYGGSEEICQQECIRMLRKGVDLYNYQTNQYAFLYNEDHAIAYYHLQEGTADKLAMDAMTGKECWSAFLGAGGEIYENEQKLIEDNIFADEHWITTKDYETYVAELEVQKNSPGTYAVTVTETLKRTVIVPQANSLEDAIARVSEAVIDRGIIQLSYDDYADREIAACDRFPQGRVPRRAEVSYYDVLDLSPEEDYER